MSKNKHIYRIFVFDQTDGSTLCNMEGFGREFTSRQEAERYCNEQNDRHSHGGLAFSQDAYYAVQTDVEPVDIESILIGK